MRKNAILGGYFFKIDSQYVPARELLRGPFKPGPISGAMLLLVILTLLQSFMVLYGRGISPNVSSSAFSASPSISVMLPIASR